jgi:RNA-binding protein 25
LIDKEKYVIPPHLHDLQEADLPETQRGLVISEIAQFRERAAKREREKARDVREALNSPIVPSGPKVREWGKPQPATPSKSPAPQQAMGNGTQGYNKPVDFVKAADRSVSPASVDEPVSSKKQKTDLELEEERQEARRRSEEASFKDVSVCVDFGVVRINYLSARETI